MNLRNILIGLLFILIGVWIYTSLSTFKVEEGSNSKRLIIREGMIRTEDEVAEKLAKDMGFDLEGAYKTGYTSMHIVEYLIKEPHEYPVTFYNGRYYEGRKTVLYLIPLSICIVLVLIGVVIILSKGKSKKA